MRPLTSCQSKVGRGGERWEGGEGGEERWEGGEERRTRFDTKSRTMAQYPVLK